MPVYNAEDSECHIYVYKDGILSAMAHDIRLIVREFRIEADLAKGFVKASFYPKSFEVEGVMKDGKCDYEILSSEDKEKITDNMLTKVLQVDDFPDMFFIGDSIEPWQQGFQVRGSFHLHGVSKEMTIYSREQEDRQSIQIKLMQEDFKIQPFKAMLGAIKIKSELTIKISIPLHGSGPIIKLENLNKEEN